MQTRRNLSMLSDFYEFTMAYGYFESGMEDTIAVFDAFYRKILMRVDFQFFQD